MASISIFQQVKELETQVGKALSAYDVSDMPRAEREAVGTLKNLLIDARLDARDYEYAQTRAEQLQAAQEGRVRLDAALKAILRVSEFGIFSAVDIAHLSAGIEHARSRME